GWERTRDVSGARHGEAAVRRSRDRQRDPRRTNMIDGFWTLRRVAAALELPFADDRPIARVWTDTRTIGPGDLFVALRGENFDAHDFIGDAVARGAAAVVVEDGSRAAGIGVPVLVVDN